MASIKKWLEEWFERVTERIITCRWLIVALMIVLAAGAVSQLPQLTIDMSDEGFLHPDDPILETYNDFRDQFGRDDMIVLAIESDNIFSQPFLRKLKKLHETLEAQVPHLDEITSMVNARNTRGVADGIIVEDLLEKWPESEKNLTALKKRVLTNPLYQDRLISADGRVTTIIIQTAAYSAPPVDNAGILAGFDDPAFTDPATMTPDSLDHQATEARTYISEMERGAIVTAASKIAANFQGDDFKISLAGSPVVTNTVKKIMRTDMMLFLRLAVILIAVCLFWMFRRISAVVYPLLVVILALVSTLAVMSIMGVAIKMPTMILPSFLLAVGVGDSVHLLAIFFQNFNQSGDKRQALVKAMGHSGLAIVMTSLTTAASLASFYRADIAPVADLGIFAAFGVLLALLYSMVFLPALIAISPIKARRPSGPDRKSPEHADYPSGVMTTILDSFTNFATRRPQAILVFTVLLLAVSFLGISKLGFSHNLLSWLPREMPVRNATEHVDRELNGSVTLEIVLDTGRENGLYEPLILNKIALLAEELKADRSIIQVGKVMSIVDVIKEIHQALNENRPEFYVIPQENRLIPQEFLLFENSGSDDLEDVVDSRFQLARITVKVPWQDAMHYVPFIKKVESLSRKLFGDEVKMETTGIMALFGRIIYAGIHSAAQSYLIAAGVITLMMVILVGSWRLGLASMLPNLTPIIVVLGLMGWVGIPLDMFTMLIGSIAIGIAVDDTVHFVYNFRRYFSQHGDAALAIRHTLQTTGRAMLTTTVVLSLGFFIFMFAAMNNLYYFGLLTGLTLILALAADFIMAPALFLLIAAKEQGRAELIKR